MNSPWDVVALRVGASMNSTPTPRAARSCTTPRTSIVDMPSRSGDLTHRCVVLPDSRGRSILQVHYPSQCTYRCVVLPDGRGGGAGAAPGRSQCTYRCVVLPDTTMAQEASARIASQCTYRCVVLPDPVVTMGAAGFMSQRTYRCVVLPDLWNRPRSCGHRRLNAPTGAWCSLTRQEWNNSSGDAFVSMHLQVRGAP